MSSQVAAVETIPTIKAFCRLSKMLYGSAVVEVDDGGGGLSAAAEASFGWSSAGIAD